MLVIDHEFVRRWSNRYSVIFKDTYDQTEEKAIRSWLSKLDEPKYLNKEYFVRLGRWKTKRQTSNYEANDANKIIDLTRTAYQANDALVKLNILKELSGVGVAVGGTILHYFHPDKFPIFDYHARNTLKKAGLWSRNVKDDTEQAWLEYTRLLIVLAKRLDVSLRDLDKALFAYDKYGPRKEVMMQPSNETNGRKKMKYGKHLGKDIIRASAKRRIDPFRTPFAPKDLGINPSDYGSFADWCSPEEATSGKYRKDVCLKVSERNHNGKPLRYVLIPPEQWQ